MPEKFVTAAPEKYASALVQLDTIPPPIENSKLLIENEILKARKMPNHAVIQPGLIWSAGLAGIGRYVEQFNSRLIGVELQCGDDYDYSRAELRKAFMTWVTRGSNLATIATPFSQWYVAGKEEERQKMTYWFYQQTTPGILRLEQFGSEQYGWWKTDGLGSDRFELAICLGNIEMGEYIQRPAFLTSQDILYLRNQ